MKDLLEQWNLWWNATADERPEYKGDRSKWRVAAARTRSPEDGDWWYTNGFKFYKNWIEWRNNNPHLKIATTEQGYLGIELEMNPVIDGIMVKMFLDRVFIDTNTGEYIIVDLKTGKRVPGSSLQLAFYSYGLRKIYGIQATTGYYWMARKGELSQAFDLADMTDDKIEALVSMFDRARKDNIFIPNFDHCNMCGLSTMCEWTTKQEQESDDE
jgi:putative RecB family exonuclease